jgi:hypothetical protein
MSMVMTTPMICEISRRLYTPRVLKPNEMSIVNNSSGRQSKQQCTEWGTPEKHHKNTSKKKQRI